MAVERKSWCESIIVILFSLRSSLRLRKLLPSGDNAPLLRHMVGCTKTLGRTSFLALPENERRDSIRRERHSRLDHTPKSGGNAKSFKSLLHPSKIYISFQL